MSEERSNQLDKEKQMKLKALQEQYITLDKEFENTTNQKKRTKLLAKMYQIEEKMKNIKLNRKMSARAKNDLIAYSFILPNFLGFAIFTLGPIIFAFALAFMKWDGNNPIQFIGIDNFITMVNNSRFQAAFVNTIIYCVATVPLTMGCALVLAIVLNQKLIGTNFFRTVAFFPHVASLVAVAAVWNMLFSPSMGPVNMILSKLGVTNLPGWAADINWALPTVIMFSVWKSMGYYMIIYLAGLQGISADIYEAASLDGANTWQKFRLITIPMLKPTTFFVTVMLTINCFKVYDQIYMITQGGPGKATLVLVYHIYETAFRDWNLGYSSAVSMVLFVLVLIVTLMQFKGEKDYSNS